jgi:hypothetical protein
MQHFCFSTYVIGFIIDVDPIEDESTYVIGFIIDVDPIEDKTTVNGKVDMLSLHLGDGRCNIICSP